MTNRRDLTTMNVSASVAVLATVLVKMRPMIELDTRAPTSAAMTYLQTAAIRDETPNPIGCPAYQNAGITRIQNDTLQATAIPAGPHGNATINSSPVVADSTIVH